MPLIGSIFVVVIVAAIGLACWGLLPKAYDKTASHFNLDKEKQKEKCECDTHECENCECEEKEKTEYEKL